MVDTQIKILSNTMMKTLLFAISILTSQTAIALDIYEELHVATFMEPMEESSDFEDIAPLVIHVETTALEHLSEIIALEEPEIEKPKELPPPPVQTELETAGARIAYKNKLLIENEQSKTIDQEVVITLTPTFFEQQEDQALHFVTDGSDRAITLIYAKKQPSIVTATEIPMDEIAVADVPFKAAPLLNLEEPANPSQPEVSVEDSTSPQEDLIAEETILEPEYPQEIPVEEPIALTEQTSDYSFSYNSNLSHCDLSNRFLFGYAFGQGIETDKNYTQYGVLLYPQWRVDPFVPFVSLNAYRLSNNQWAGSFGGAVRWPDQETYVYGMNVFYDFIKQHLGTFQQIGIGVECLSHVWEGRFNVYFPIETDFRMRTVAFYDECSRNYFFRIKNWEQAQRGFDAELGYNYYICDSLRCYAGAGPAWFKESYQHTSQWAFKLRGLIEWNDYISLECRTFKEGSHKWECQGLAWLSIPMDIFQGEYCPCDLTDLFKRLIYRNAVIKTSNSCCWELNY